MSAIILKGFKKKQLDTLVADINNSNNSYYFVLSKPTEWPNGSSTPPTPTDTVEEINNFRREIIAGKKIRTLDVSFLARKITWSSDTIYDYYRDDDSDLSSKNFFVVTSANRVYKCLFNNNSANSTVEPSETTTNTFQTADGYIWKYMYDVTSYANTKFSSDDYIPIVVNTSITSAAVNGSIDVITINNSGNGYIAHALGDITQVISNTTFKIQNANTSSSNGFYNTSGFYIYYGSGTGQLSQISSYISNTSGKYVVTSSQITSVDTTSKFRITPFIRIDGDGSNASAICTVDADDNYKINSVTVLNSGINYSYANAVIVANSSYGTGANLNIIMPPKGGHASDPVRELDGSVIGISVQFDGSEGNTIPTETDFRKVGIISNPTHYSNTSIYKANTINGMHVFEISTPSSGFPINEFMESDSATKDGSIIAAFSNSSIIKAISYQGEFDIYTDNYPGNISISGNTITGNGTEFAVSSNNYNLETGDLISFNDGSGWYVYRVATVTDNTSITVAEADGITSVNSSISNAAMFYQKYRSDRLLPTTVDGYAFILDINTPDINKFSGDLLYYNYTEPTQRSNTSVENAKLILRD